jgi:hypothetical protein
MVWPNSRFWNALADGARIEVDGGILRLSVVDCGTLVAPVGRLVACDPFAYLRPTGNPYIAIPPREYPIKVTLADVSGREDGSHIREVYASLLLSDEPEITRRVLTPLVDSARCLRPTRDRPRGLVACRYRLSDRETADLLATVWQLPISVGSIVACTERTSQAIAPVTQAR